MSARLDSGRPFDWGRTSSDYGKFRDIYPQHYYETIVDLGVGLAGQRILDLGTGTGELPRHLHHLGAHWSAVDASDSQIAEARRLSGGLDIAYAVGAAEDMPFADAQFDAVTAAQCFFYFDHDRLQPQLRRVLKPGGRVLITYLSWLPGEDAIAAASEAMVLRYNPAWSGGGETFRPADVPPQYGEDFVVVNSREERLALPFSRESWHGRMRACRGTGASLSPAALAAWETEHRPMLEREAPADFHVQHCLAYALLEKK